MLNKKKTAAVSLAVAALIVSAPVAASADSYNETPGAGVSAASIRRCEVSTVMFDAGFFQPGEHVAVSVSGAAAAQARISGDTANADGAMAVSFTPPPGGEGAYRLSFDGSRDYVATVAVVSGRDIGRPCQGDLGTATAADVQRPSDDAILARTGGDVSPWALGGGAFALAAGGVLIAAGAKRRSRQG